MLINVVRTKKDFKGISQDWNNLAISYKNPLLLHDWFLCCAEAFYKEEDLQIITVRSHGRIIAIAPLVRIKRNGINTLELLGASYLHEPCCLLYENEEALCALLEAVLETGNPLFLQKIPSISSAESSAISAACFMESNCS